MEQSVHNSSPESTPCQTLHNTHQGLACCSLLIPAAMNMTGLCETNNLADLARYFPTEPAVFLVRSTRVQISSPPNKRPPHPKKQSPGRQTAHHPSTPSGQKLTLCLYVLVIRLQANDHGVIRIRHNDKSHPENNIRMRRLERYL